MGKNKLNNSKHELDGLKFDSKKEMERYSDLKQMERAGLISDLRCQVPYTVIPAYKGIQRECKYIADFAYIQDGKEVVEDVKGWRGGATYYVFKIKKKLMYHVFGIEVKEI